MRFAGKRKDTNPITCENPPPTSREEPLTQHMWKRVNKEGKGGGETGEGDNSWKERGRGSKRRKEPLD